MNERSKKWMLCSTLTIFLLSISAIVYSFLINSRAGDIYFPIGIICEIFSGLLLISILSLKYRDYKWFRLISNASAYLLPLYIVILFFVTNYIHSQIIILLFATVIGIFIVSSMINIFIIREAGELKGILILLLLIVISFAILRIPNLNGKILDLDFVFFLTLTIAAGFGMLMFGIRCLFQIHKNSYLKIISSIANVFIAFGSIVFVAKMQSEKTDIIELFYFIPAFLLTLIVLFSLPFSTYIHWSLLDKRILKKIMTIWIFFFLTFSISFVFPDVFKKIVFIKDQNSQNIFQMKDYELQNKNGLNPE